MHSQNRSWLQACAYRSRIVRSTRMVVVEETESNLPLRWEPPCHRLALWRADHPRRHSRSPNPKPDAPQIVVIVGKLFCQRQAKTQMSIGGNNGVLEVVRIAIAQAAKIKPGLRVLVNEQRRERSNVAQTVVFESNALPC